MGMAGGSGVSYLFRVKSDHTQIQKADGSAAATALTDAALKIGGAVSRKDILVQTDYTYNEDGTLNIKWSQTKNDAALDALLEIACPRKVGASSTGLQELIDESGDKIGGDTGTASDVDYLVLSYGAKDADDKLPITISIGNILKTAGTYSMTYNNWNQPTLEFKSKACVTTTVGGLEIPTALFDDTIVDTDGTPTWVVVKFLVDYYSKIIRVSPV